MKEQKRTTILLLSLFLGYTVVYIDKLSVSFSLIPISEEFHLEPSAKGLIMSAFFAGYAIMQIPMGLIINKVGARKVLIFSVLGIGIFAILFGFGTSLIIFMIIRFLTGFLAHSGYPSSASKELTINFPPEKRTFAQGILLSSSGIASIVGPLVLSPIITNFGWQSAYYAVTVLAIVTGIVLVVAISKSKKEVNEKNIPQQEKISMKTVCSDKRVWILFFSAFCINCLIYGTSNWIPSFLIAERGLTLNDAGRISAFAGIFILVGSLGGSYIVGKYFQEKEKQVVAITTILGSLFVFTLYFMNGMISLTFVLSMANLCLMIAFVTLMSIPLKLFVGARFAPSYATLGMGGILGGFVSPMLIGMLVQKSGGFISSFIFLLVMGVLSALIILLVNQNVQEREVV